MNKININKVDEFIILGRKFKIIINTWNKQVKKYYIKKKENKHLANGKRNKNS